jgi:hypothetical protein
MTVTPPHDEFRERARLVAESQGIADAYAGGLRRRAIRAFLIGGWCLLLMWLVWEIATSPVPRFIDRSPAFQELLDRGGR